VNAEALRGHIDTMVLAALRGVPAHGYALVGRLAEQSDGAFTLGEGTVYPALHRLEADGLIASSWTRHAGRRRRVYRLTAAGESSLADRRGEWRVFTGGMNALLDSSA
jgi:PadR family transcriptional regulator, regulatory protein PadR